MDGRICNKEKTTTVKQAVEKHNEASRRELDKSSTVLCASMSIPGIPGQGYFHCC